MIVFRLHPAEDLKKGIENKINEYNLKSGIIICIVGSLNSAILRTANESIRAFKGPFEIVSAEGTVSVNGIHVHIAIADSKGTTIGGHLREGCIINTTAEIGILKSNSTFKRIFDPKTGYKELVIQD